MRFADLLVDLAAVAIASRSVAAKHIALRARQLDRYQKTSSIVSSLAQQRQQKHPKDAQYQSQKQSQTSSQGWDESVASAQPLPDSEPPIVRSEQFVQPAVRSQDNPAKPRPGFTPAPWASRAAVAAAAGTRALMPTHRPVPVSPTGNPPDQSDALPSEGVDFNIFRTSKGSRILESLKEKPRSEPSVPRPPIQVSSGDEIAAPRPEMEISPAGFDALTDLIAGARPRSVETSASDTTHTRAAVVEEVAPTAEPLAEQDAILVAELAARTPSTAAYELRESTVPSSRIGRLWNYGGLAAGMFAGAIGEGLSRAVGGGSSQGSVMLSAANMERLVTKLSRMRGAALKLGQMMSFQDAKMLPAPMQEVLQRVQDRADYMPAWQRDRVLTTDLGAEWRDLFDEFEDKPIAAASIGQVHRATLKSNSARVAVKIQFPGVADSINSDLDNISILLVATQMLPKGLYLNKTIDNARTELAWECDYEREAECAGRYRELLAGNDDDVFSVPKMYPEACGKHVLTMEFMDGVGVTRVKSFTQEQRDWIGTQILRLCLREITEFKFMQTDPNWTNFLYNAEKKKLELLDFGASREYPDEFISRYVQLLDAASRSDRDQVKILSEELGYLTGHESKAMLDAHIISVTTLAEPFLQSAPEIYDFRDQTITERVKAQIPVMIHERLAPPPEETYSLHRKLSGAFLLCARLGSRVRCRELFENALAKMVN